MSNELIREPVVAGSFYPGDASSLTRQIANLFSEAEKPVINGELVGLVCPHAGYIYSGHVAAVGYKLLEGMEFDVVAVISPSHVNYFDGVSVYSGSAYTTPLGKVDIDTELAEMISTGSNIVFKGEIGHDVSSFRGEHALEVQLPFLQIVLGKFKLLPLIMGEQKYSTCEGLAEDLYRVLKDKKALIVASSDLSHFHSSREADRLDHVFIEHFEAFNPRALAQSLDSKECEACGGGPVISAMIYANKLGSPYAKALKYADSASTSGDFSNVVGYLSGAISIE
ncbi:MAG: AmmeMemoRadiSam system protein B [candidate division Zixibacteria bacterium]|nr:AmmeMemoRadiSam system protein B [candidate division Zixibacteria bacterium]